MEMVGGGGAGGWGGGEGCMHHGQIPQRPKSDGVGGEGGVGGKQTQGTNEKYAS